MQPRISAHVAGRVHDLLDQRRIFLIPGDPAHGIPPGAVVNGDTDTYRVWFSPEGAVCECYASTDESTWCCHVLAVMVAWSEQAELPR